MVPQVAGKTFWVVGLARSGCAAGGLLRRHGARVIGIDDAEEAAVRRRWEREGLSKLAPEAFDEILTGGGWPRIPPAAVVISPGVRPDHRQLIALDRSVEILGELELAARFCRARLVAITGTNGKSTTTEWAAHLVARAGLRAEALGNLGRPLALMADQLEPQDVAVIEVSSFQLETDAAVPAGGRSRPEPGSRSSGPVPGPGVLLRRQTPVVRGDPRRRLLCDLDRLPRGAGLAHRRAPAAVRRGSRRRRGLHPGRRPVPGRGRPGAPAFRAGRSFPQSPPNLLNAQAALAIGLALGLDPASLAPVLADYRGLAHRHQLVGRLQGVDFIDDSKATNVHAVCAGLCGYPRPVVLIAGGSAKGEDFAPLAEVMAAVRHVVLIGQEGPRIGAALAGVVPTSLAGTLEEAVALAAGLAAPLSGGVVLLSPACASFDMFANYHARGEAFAAAVLALGAEPIPGRESP